jgi:hypothetical protein
MKIDRRKTLIGLGTLASGSGILFGTGAFTQVTAERSVSASITTDSNANLALTPDNNNITTTSNSPGSRLQVDVSSLNENATTVFGSVFTIDNNGEDGVGIRITAYDDSDTDVTGGALTFSSNANDQDLTSFPTASGDDHNLDPDGGSDETVTVGITFDDRNGDPTGVDYIEIEANADEYQG